MKRETITRMLDMVDEQYISEAAIPDCEQEGPERIVHMKKKRIITLALAAALLIALGVTAYAANLFGLKDLTVGQGRSASVIVAGWPDAPEEQAAKEWQNYRQHARHNVPDSGIIFSDTDLVSQCGAYSPEAKEKLADILRRYHLRLPEQILFVPGIEGLYSVCGNRGFLPESVGARDGYPISGNYFRGGSFTLDDAAKLGEKTVRFDMVRSVKGYFTGTVGFTLDTSGMEEWTYTTSSGTETILNLGPARAAAVIPLENSFVYIHFRSGSESGYDSGFDLLTKEDLEAFVELIDFEKLDAVS